MPVAWRALSFVCCLVTGVFVSLPIAYFVGVAISDYDEHREDYESVGVDPLDVAGRELRAVFIVLVIATLLGSLRLVANVARSWDERL